MCSEYTKFVLEALELEDTIKNYERRDATGWFAPNNLFLFLIVISVCLSSHFFNNNGQLLFTSLFAWVQYS